MISVHTCFSSAAPIETKKRNEKRTVLINRAENTKQTTSLIRDKIVWIVCVIIVATRIVGHAVKHKKKQEFTVRQTNEYMNLFTNILGSYYTNYIAWSKKASKHVVSCWWTSSAKSLQSHKSERYSVNMCFNDSVTSLFSLLNSAISASCWLQFNETMDTTFPFL